MNENIHLHEDEIAGRDILVKLLRKMAKGCGVLVSSLVQFLVHKLTHENISLP